MNSTIVSKNHLCIFSSLKYLKSLKQRRITIFWRNVFLKIYNYDRYWVHFELNELSRALSPCSESPNGRVDVCAHYEYCARLWSTNGTAYGRGDYLSCTCSMRNLRQFPRSDAVRTLSAGECLLHNESTCRSLNAN